jgi:glycosyltransferase involved in cell wall biosynthesis
LTARRAALEDSRMSIAASAPAVSLLLLAHNQEGVARAAARSCLAQTGAPLEIILSDDASSDSTFGELQAAAANYDGPHRVRVRRNAVNLGIGAHYNRLLDEASGELLVTAAGDDLSLPNRVERLVQAWERTGRRADLIASHFVDMMRDGSVVGTVRTDDLGSCTLASWLSRIPHSVGATHAFTRRMMQRFGAFIDDICYEDRIMVLRALCDGGAVTVREPLVHYRRGGTSSGRRVHTAEHLLHWHRARNRLRLAEVRQMVQDARLAGCGEAVEAALAEVLARERYRQQMLDADSAAARVRLLLARAKGVPLGWRVRKFVALAAPVQAAALRRIDDRLFGRSS